MKLGSHSWGKLICVGMCGLCLAAYPTVSREISGSSYVVNVDGTDADEALTQADYAALLGGGTPLDLVKTGTGRLYIPFEMTNTVDAARNWQGSTIVSNGYLRADFVGSLGDATGSLTVVPGASFECNWTAAEVGTPMQKRHIYVGGDGVDNERGALRSWTGDTYAFGLLDFTADTYVNDKRNGSDIPGRYGDACIGVRYNDIFLNGHSVTVGGAMHLAAFAGLYGPGKLVADNWTSLSFEGAVYKHDPSVQIEIRWGAELKLTVYSETADDYYTMPVRFEPNTALAALPVWNAQASDRVFLNGWGGPVELHGDLV